jgi:hypothetical protein
MVVVRGGIGREETVMGEVLATISGLPIIPIGGIQIGVLREGETRRIISKRP